jgi:hypothetical protein
MEQIEARLLCGDAVVVADAEVWLDVGRASSGLKEWHCFVSLPSPDVLHVGDQLRLETSDGRSGELFVSLFRAEGGQFVYTLQGTGPLHEPLT